MRRKGIFHFSGSLAITFLLMLGCGATKVASQEATPEETINLNVFAAISLTNALEEIEELYEQSQPSVDVIYTFASSGALAQQIQQGVPADVFFSAATREVDILESANLLAPGTRRDVLSNRLAIVTPVDSTLTISSVQDLASPEVTGIAIGQPSSVPAGLYAEELLTTFGLFDELESKITFGQNVRAVLSLVETGQVDAGIVYVTDALQSNLVEIANIPPTNAYSPIVYPAAAIASSSNPEIALDFLNFLSSEPATEVFEDFGFTTASATPVPEPSPVLGTLVLGTLVLGVGLKRRKIHKREPIELYISRKNQVKLLKNLPAMQNAANKKEG